MGIKEWLGSKLKDGRSARAVRSGVRLGRHGVGRDYAEIRPLDGYSFTGKKLKNKTNYVISFGRTQIDAEPQFNLA